MIRPLRRAEPPLLPRPVGLEVLPVHRPAVAVAPLLVRSVFIVADVLLGPTQVVLGLVVIAPLLAASVVG